MPIHESGPASVVGHAQDPNELGGMGSELGPGPHGYDPHADVAAGPHQYDYGHAELDWHARQAPHANAGERPLLPSRIAVPIQAEGQDLSGGHQGVDITITLAQPQAGAQLFGSAVQQALGRDYDRLECRLLALDGPVMVSTSKEQAEQAYGVGLGSAGATPVTVGVSGEQTAPGANTTIATTLTLPPGTYTVSGSNTLLGAAAASELINFQLYIGATATGIALAAANSPVPFGPITVTISAATFPNGATISIHNNAAGGAGIVYLSSLFVTAQSAPSVIVPGQFSWLPVGIERARRNCDEVWLSLPGPNATTSHVAVMVSRRLGVESATLARP